MHRASFLDAIVCVGKKVMEEVMSKEDGGKFIIFMKHCEVDIMQHLLMQ